MNIFLNLFSGLATLLTGTVVIVIYFVQKKDTKRQAARVLLTEIRIAEERIGQISDKMLNNNVSDLPSVFPTKNWKQYSHLFVSDFDQDELKLINSFYDYGELVEDFARRNNNFFWISTEERSKATLHFLSSFITEAMTQPSQQVDAFINNKMSFFSNALDRHNIPYSPQKTIDGIKNYLSKINKITTSSCGTKLKKLGGFE